jgi:hypothetical protein
MSYPSPSWNLDLNIGHACGRVKLGRDAAVFAATG